MNSQSKFQEQNDAVKMYCEFFLMCNFVFIFDIFMESNHFQYV